MATEEQAFSQSSASQMCRFRLCVAYVGTRYSGWQIQEKPLPPPTIQGELEAILSRVTGKAIRVHGSGRTDAGVHADGQVAHVDIPLERAGLDWQYILNRHLPHDISIVDMQPAPADFHARFDARGKRYIYHLWTNQRYVPPRLFPFVWACGSLDTDAIQCAMKYFLGCHDFASFQTAGTDVEGTVRTVRHLAFTSRATLFSDAALLAIEVEADGFLKQMVRNIVGALVAVGQGKFSPEALPALLEARDRRLLPSATAPAQGLTLHQVFYGGVGS